MHDVLAALVAETLRCDPALREHPVATPSEATARSLAPLALDLRVAPLHAHADGAVRTLLLLDGEFGEAGEAAEGMVAEIARVLRPGGTVLAAAPGAVAAALSGVAAGSATEAPPARPRSFTAEAFAEMFGHAGFLVEDRWAPGAAARLAGAPPALDAARDRLPGLLDAGPLVALRARRYADADERSRSFFASLPRKVVAASVVCRDAEGRLLLVHDAFKGHWTIPGGVVDADEDPRSAAEREAWEEAGLRVAVRGLLGVFSASWPDRLVFVFEGVAEPGVPAPVHRHEVDDVAWVPLPDALDRLAGYVAAQVRQSLSAPGGVWRQGPSSAGASSGVHERSDAVGP